MKSAILLNANFVWVLFNMITSNAKEESFSALKFCHDNKIYAFSSSACSGGIRFISDSVQPLQDCFCAKGTFITIGAEFGGDYSIISGTGKCMVFNGNNIVVNDNSTSDFYCAEDSELSRWQIISLTEYSAGDVDFIAMWSDPSKLGEFKDFRKFPIGSFRDGLLFGKKKSATVTIAIVKSTFSTLSEVGIGGNCFITDNSEGGVFIFSEMKLTKRAEDKDNIQNNCTSSDKKVSARQIVSTREDTEFDCEMSSSCIESDESFAIYENTPEPLTKWSLLKENERKEKIHSENVQLVEYRMRIEHQGARVVVDYYSQRLILVNISTRILQKGAADVIPPSLIETAFKLFHYLYFDVDIGPHMELENNDHDKIMYMLEQCLLHMEPMRFGKSGCPVTLDSYSSTAAKGVTVSYDKSEMPADRKFDPLKNDAIIELMWKAVDFTHAQCFSYFKYPPNLHHYFEKQMEILFLMEEVQYRWNRDIPAGMKLYGPILPKMDSIMMENLDFLVGSAHLNTVYDNWLKKPVLDLEKAQREAKVEPVTRNLNKFQIWGGLAYCLDYKPIRHNIERTGVTKPITGLNPSLSVISEVMQNGPRMCKKEGEAGTTET